MSTGKQEFIESFDSPHVDPLADSYTDFDWELLYESLGEGQAEVEQRDYKAMSHAVRTLFAWILKIQPGRASSERTIARRLIGIAWTIDPSLIEDSPSLTAIAKSLGCHKVVLSIHSAAARREFGIFNRGQAHGWNWKVDKGQAQDAPKSPKRDSVPPDHPEGGPHV